MYDDTAPIKSAHPMTPIFDHQLAAAYTRELNDLMATQYSGATLVIHFDALARIIGKRYAYLALRGAGFGPLQSDPNHYYRTGSVHKDELIDLDPAPFLRARDCIDPLGYLAIFHKDSVQ